MTATSPLLIDLAGVARLADVQRPVASVWRSRFASTADPFPPAAGQSHGRDLFDAQSVAQWLVRTKHGNNLDAIADAAASGTPVDFDVTDPQHVACIDALLALRSASGASVGGRDADELNRWASEIDPEDSCLVAEVARAPASWAAWADLLADAAYSPIEASRLLERRHAATQSSAGSSGPLAPSAEALVAELAGAFAPSHQAELVVGAEIGPSLATDIVERVGDEADLVVSALPEGRRIHRRRLCDGSTLPMTDSITVAPRLLIERFPTSAAQSTSAILRAVDEIVLSMRHHDHAVVLAPARTLVGAVSTFEALSRADILRSGRVRAIAKLPAGLLTAAPREALALWVLGSAATGVSLADRVTAIADLTDVDLSNRSRTSLINDVLAATGSAHDMHAHAFRFARLARTASLIAAPGAFIVDGTASANGAIPTRDLPALLDTALRGLGADAPESPPLSEPGVALPAASVQHLISAGHLRVRAGTRVAADEYYDSGFVVVGPADLDEPSRIGYRHVDPIVFRARHSANRLTAAGDVIFRTAPTPMAWVDPEGSKVVLYPARALRINRADTGGLVPELVTADIAGSPGGAGAWKRWRLRRVAHQTVEPLSDLLAELAIRRESLARRVESLDYYTDLLLDGVVSGSVTFPDPAAPAASD